MVQLVHPMKGRCARPAGACPGAAWVGAAWAGTAPAPSSAASATATRGTPVRGRLRGVVGDGMVNLLMARWVESSVMDGGWPG